MESKERLINGTVKLIRLARPIKEGSKLLSLGIQLTDSSWHNIVGFDKVELDAKVEDFKEGDYVALHEKQNEQNYWNVSKIEKLELPKQPLQEMPPEQVGAQKQVPNWQTKLDVLGDVLAACYDKVVEKMGKSTTPELEMQNRMDSRTLFIALTKNGHV